MGFFCFFHISLCSGRSEVVELVQRNNGTHASERQRGKNVAPGNDYLVIVYVWNFICYSGYLQ